MKSDKEIKGFTILETIIVLLLTSLVVSLTFAYLGAFQKYMRKNLRMTDYETRILSMESLMNYDFDRCKDVYINHNELIFVLDSTEIVYELKKTELIRIQDENADTLKGNSVEFEVFNSEDHPKLLSGFKLIFLDNNHEERTFYFNKVYDVKNRFEEFYKRNFN